MNKKFVIKTLTILSSVLVAATVVLAAILAILTVDSLIRGFAIGTGIGAIIGGVLNYFVIIPKRYKDKDERSLLVEVLASLISASVFGLASYLFFLLVLTGVMDIATFDSMNILLYAGIIIVLTLVSEKLSYLIIDKTL
ncbi:MAG: hypothetical protein AB1Z23_01655 [Eubacteriales bacterium]